MTGTHLTGAVIVDLRRGAVDPSSVLTGPLRGVALQRLEPGQSTEISAEGVEHALYVTCGSGQAATPETQVPLAEGTALTLPLGTRAVMAAGSDGLEYVHAVLAVTEVPEAPEAPEAPEEGPDDRHH